MTRQHKILTPGQTPTADTTVIAGTGDTDATLDIGGKTFPLSEIVQSAFESSGLSLEEWNDQDPEKRDAAVAEQVTEIGVIQAKADARGVNLSDQRVKAVDGEPIKKRPYGVLPHPNEVDPQTITAPVQTTHGWIVPANPPAQPKR